MILLWCGSTTNGMLWCFLISFSSIPQTFILTEEVLQSFHMFHCWGVTAKLASGFTYFFLKHVQPWAMFKPKNGRMIPPDFGICWPNKPNHPAPRQQMNFQVSTRCWCWWADPPRSISSLFRSLRRSGQGDGSKCVKRNCESADTPEKIQHIQYISTKSTKFNTYLNKWEVDHSS